MTDEPVKETVFVHCRKVVERCACVPPPIAKHGLFGDCICVFRRIDQGKPRELVTA